jgi:hypothetical protein
MFALLVPAGFALVVRVVKGNAHQQHAAAERKAKACAQMRGAAAGALPDADVAHWRERAILATDRIKGLESIITVRRGVAEPEQSVAEPEQTVACWVAAPARATHARGRHAACGTRLQDCNPGAHWRRGRDASHGALGRRAWLRFRHLSHLRLRRR